MSDARPPTHPDPVLPAAEGELLTRQQASAFLSTCGIRMKPATLARAWSTGSGGPPCRHVRGKPYYPLEVLRAWALAQTTALRSSPFEARTPRPGPTS